MLCTTTWWHLPGKSLEAVVPYQYDVCYRRGRCAQGCEPLSSRRAITYLQLANTPAVRPGGIVILPVPCPEGAGQGSANSDSWLR